MATPEEVYAALHAEPIHGMMCTYCGMRGNIKVDSFIKTDITDGSYLNFKVTCENCGNGFHVGTMCGRGIFIDHE